MSGESFSETKSWASGGRLIIGIFVVVIVLSMCGRRSASLTPDEIGSRLDAERGSHETVLALRTHYPRDYQEMLSRLSAATENGGGESAAAREIFVFMRGFMTAKSDFLARAPAADLRNWATTMNENVLFLRRTDTALCARFVTDGFGQAERLPAEMDVRLDHSAALMITAARHGEDARIPNSALSEREGWAALSARMRQLDPHSQTLLAANALERATPAEQCAAGSAIYQAALDLPGAESAAVLGSIARGQVSGQR